MLRNLETNTKSVTSCHLDKGNTGHVCEDVRSMPRSHCVTPKRPAVEHGLGPQTRDTVPSVSAPGPHGPRGALVQGGCSCRGPGGLPVPTCPLWGNPELGEIGSSGRSSDRSRHPHRLLGENVSYRTAHRCGITPSLNTEKAAQENLQE